MEDESSKTQESTTGDYQSRVNQNLMEISEGLVVAIVASAVVVVASDFIRSVTRPSADLKTSLSIAEGPPTTVYERNALGLMVAVTRRPLLRIYAPTEIRTFDKPTIRAHIENADTAKYSGTLTCLSCSVNPAGAGFPTTLNGEWTWTIAPTDTGTTVIRGDFVDTAGVFQQLSQSREIQVRDELNLTRRQHYIFLVVSWLLSFIGCSALLRVWKRAIIRNIRRIGFKP